MKIRSPEIVKQATNLFDVDVNTLKFLGGEDGDVYEVHQDSLAYILKLVPTTEQNILTLTEKIDFAHYLRDHGVRLAQWIPSIHGRLIEVVLTDEMVVAVTKMEKVAGHHPNMGNAKEWNAALFSQWPSSYFEFHT